MDRKVVIITGANSGIGRATADALLRENCIVYDFSRRDTANEKVNHLRVDVIDEENVISAVRDVYERQGRIDIVINCAGYGISGAVEFTSLEDAKSQFDVNFFGTVNVNKAVIPYMRQAGKGRIVNISSVAAVAHIPFQTFYSASKAAIESYTCALANEVKAFGISVTAVQPGDICTEFTQARKKTFEGDDVYGGRISKSVAGMERDEKKGMSPQTAGRYIARIALKNKVKPAYAIGLSYKLVCVLCKVFPGNIRNSIIGMLYAR